jgi:hypothetical protein
MKRFIYLGIVSFFSATVAFGQAEVVFANFGGGVNAIVTDASHGGVPISGSAWSADLFYGTTLGNNNLNLSQLTDAGVAVPFQSGGGAGYFLGGGMVLPVSGNIEFAVAVWQTAAGASWAQATGGGAGNVITYTDNGGTEWGFSAPVTFTPNVSPAGDSPLNGLQPFVVGSPEPSTWVVGLTGAFVLFVFQRGRNRRGSSARL